MPTPHLTTVNEAGGRSGVSVAGVEAAIAQVLAGSALPDVANSARMSTADLAAAVEVYQDAGRRALAEAHDPGWWQVYIHFPDWNQAERTFTDHIAPLLHCATATGLVSTWWFIRKHPCWRLRIQPATTESATTDDLGAAFDQLATTGVIQRWSTGIYEPESAAFGGDAGIDIAHAIFAADSQQLSTVLFSGQMALGRRELSLLLCATLMRAAHLEWYEQGDVWHRITQDRPLGTDASERDRALMSHDVQRLLLADTTNDSRLLRNGALAPAANWIAAFHHTGKALHAAAQGNRLHRGLRDVISYHVIFHWNRLGLPLNAQRVLADTAARAILATGQP